MKDIKCPNCQHEFLLNDLQPNNRAVNKHVGRPPEHDIFLPSIKTYLDQRFKNLEYLEWELCLMSELPKNGKPAPGKLYFAKQADNLKYIVLTLKNNNIEENLDISIKEELTQELLNIKKVEILKITSEKGHTFSAKYIGNTTISAIVEGIKSELERQGFPIIASQDWFEERVRDYLENNKIFHNRNPGRRPSLDK